jgi:hypothetical protein
MCSGIDCEHLGTNCEAPGCDNLICKTHEQCCSSCEKRYCEDCYETHLEACPGSLIDPHNQIVELQLADEAVFSEVIGTKIGDYQ